MFQNQKILAMIAARGGSKGVPGKNIKPLGGKPLIGWIIETAKKSKYIDRIILSSDDSKIMDTARIFGCDVPFTRPAELAEDESSVNDVILHGISEVRGYDYILLLQPTSPLTRTADIDGCIEALISNHGASMVSVTAVSKSPYWMFTMQGTRLDPLMGEKYLNRRRQDLPAVYMPTGAFYLARTEWFVENKSFYAQETRGYVVPEAYSIDIDTPLDFKLFEVMTADDTVS